MDFVDKMASSHKQEIIETLEGIEAWLKVCVLERFVIPFHVVRFDVLLYSWFSVDLDDSFALPSSTWLQTHEGTFGSGQFLYEPQTAITSLASQLSTKGHQTVY